jgi:type I restriction-modification system DNA methylase subunit
VHEHNGVIVGKARRIGPGVSAGRARFNEVLFVDARGLGHMVSRTNRELSAEDIGGIADTYHAWRGEEADLNRMRTSPASRMGTSPAAVPRRISTRSATMITYSYPASTSAASPSRAMGNRLTRKIARLTAGIGD